MSSRALRDGAEKNSLIGVAICGDGVALVVHNNNTITNISAADLSDIYTKTKTTWNRSQLSGVKRVPAQEVALKTR
jgi:phosphate transport system substrate-binding protein